MQNMTNYAIILLRFAVFNLNKINTAFFVVGGSMDILNYHIKLLGDAEFKVEKKTVNWNEILFNPQAFYSEITKILLDERSLYYFVSNNNDAKVLHDSLSEKQKNKINMVFEELIKNPQEFYTRYQKEKDLLDKLEIVSTDIELIQFTKTYGIKYPKNGSDFSKKKGYVKKSIKNESAYGIFGEIMLYVVIEKLISNRNIIISKLSYITAPGTYAHGSDGLFFDEINKTLFFGEAKFTINIGAALEQALTSLNKIKERMKLDQDFILLHEGSFKNGYSLEIFDNNKIDELNKCVIVFAMHGEEYSDEKISNILNNYMSKFFEILDSNASIELISFPIVSKEGLKDEISRQVTMHYGNC